MVRFYEQKPNSFKTKEPIGFCLVRFDLIINNLFN